MSTASGPHVTVEDHFAIIPEALLCDRSADDGMVRVYGVLRRHGSDPNNCYPSYRRIADLTGKSKRSIPAIIHRLAKAGWVTVVPRRDDAGDPTSNAYVVHSTRVDRSDGGSLERGVYASERAPSTRENAGGSTRENAPKESKGEREQGGTRESGAEVEVATDAVVLDPPLSPAALAEHLRQFLIRHEHRIPSTPKSWVTEMERMLRDDERDPELVRQAIDWVDAGFAAGDMTGAGFWADKVSTPGKLRRHFGLIVTQARQAQQKQPRGSQATQRAWETSQAIRALFGDELPDDFNPLDRIAGYPPADPRW